MKSEKIPYKAKNKYIEISDAFGELLSRYEWEYFLVLTFRNTIYKDTVRTAMNHFSKYIRAPKHGSIFWASESYNASRERHVHCVASTGQNIEKLKKFWIMNYGNCWIDIFNYKLKGEDYTSKFVGYPSNDYDIIINPNIKIRVDKSLEESVGNVSYLY